MLPLSLIFLLLITVLRASFKFKHKITGNTAANGTKSFEIMDPLVYLSNFWRTREIRLINREFNLILT